MVVWCGAYAICCVFIQPLFLRRLGFRISELKDTLDLLVISGKVSPTDEAIFILRKRMAIAEESLARVNATNLLFMFVDLDEETKLRVKQETAVIAASSETIRKISSSLDLTMGGGFAVNSPMLLGVVFLLLSGAAIYFWFAEKVKTALLLKLWDALNSQSSPQHAMAH